MNDEMVIIDNTWINPIATFLERVALLQDIKYNVIYMSQII